MQELIGSFEVKSGALRVTDPCYFPDIWCAGVVNGARNGRWNAYVTYRKVDGWGTRVSELEVRANFESDCPKDDSYLCGETWQPCSFEVGVDSGQAGVFDLAEYPRGKSDEGSFYKDVSELTLGRRNAGTIGYGAVSSSGFGDGGYQAFMLMTPSMQVVGVRIVFITENDLNEDERREDEIPDWT